MAISKKVRGGRKAFFESSEHDRLLAMLTRFMAEHWALRERLSIIEALLAKQGHISAEDIENFEPDRATSAQWDAARDEMIRAVLEFGQNIEE